MSLKHPSRTKAVLSGQVDKYDADGTFIETVTIEPREVYLTQSQVEQAQQGQLGAVLDQIEAAEAAKED